MTGRTAPAITGERTLYHGRASSLVEIGMIIRGKHTTKVALRQPDAVVVLPIMKRDRILLVEQYRPPIGRWMLQLPAGTLDPKELPASCASRELEEETGYKAASVQLMYTAYPLSNTTNTKVHYFIATGLDKGMQSLGERELIRNKVVRLPRLLRMMESNRIEDGNLMQAALYYVSFLRKEGRRLPWHGSS